MFRTALLLLFATQAKATIAIYSFGTSGAVASDAVNVSVLGFGAPPPSSETSGLSLLDHIGVAGNLVFTTPLSGPARLTGGHSATGSGPLNVLIGSVSAGSGGLAIPIGGHYVSGPTLAGPFAITLNQTYFLQQDFSETISGIAAGETVTLNLPGTSGIGTPGVPEPGPVVLTMSGLFAAFLKRTVRKRDANWKCSR